VLELEWRHSGISTPVRVLRHAVDGFARHSGLSTPVRVLTLAFDDVAPYESPPSVGSPGRQLTLAVGVFVLLEWIPTVGSVGDWWVDTGVSLVEKRACFRFVLVSAWVVCWSACHGGWGRLERLSTVVGLVEGAVHDVLDEVGAGWAEGVRSSAVPVHVSVVDCRWWASPLHTAVVVEVLRAMEEPGPLHTAVVAEVLRAMEQPGNVVV
jgi:hypothetical protein